MRRLLFCRARRRRSVLIGFGGAASAYPQFQFSSGTNRCSQCHFSPAGGGLITSWGRDETRRHHQPRRRRRASCTARGRCRPGWRWAPTCAWPARATHDGGPESPQTAWFPMQADLYARFAFSDRSRSISRVACAARCGRDQTLQRRPDFDSVTDRFISREHYLMWRPERDRPLRAHRALLRAVRPALRRAHLLRPPLHRLQPLQRDLQRLGRLRRRRLGAAPDAVHAAAVELPRSAAVGRRAGDRAAPPTSRSGSTAMAALALQARLGVGSEASRYQGGLVGKLWIEPGEDAVPGRGATSSGRSSGERRLASARTSSSPTWAPPSSRSAA